MSWEWNLCDSCIFLQCIKSCKSVNLSAVLLLWGLFTFLNPVGDNVVAHTVKVLEITCILLLIAIVITCQVKQKCTHVCIALKAWFWSMSFSSNFIVKLDITSHTFIVWGEGGVGGHQKKIKFACCIWNTEVVFNAPSQNFS